MLFPEPDRKRLMDAHCRTAHFAIYADNHHTIQLQPVIQHGNNIDLQLYGNHEWLFGSYLKGGIDDGMAQVKGIEIHIHLSFPECKTNIILIEAGCFNADDGLVVHPFQNMDGQ